MMAHRDFSDANSIDGLEPISPSRCRELLASQTIGRIAWQAADGPQILPVTYACYDGTIIFRTSPYGVLSELVRPTDVAMEIDELDQESRGDGVWSYKVARKGLPNQTTWCACGRWAVWFPGPRASGTYSSKSFPSG
jgi:uncharacterized protein